MSEADPAGDPQRRPGWVHRRVREELPGLAVHQLAVAARAVRSPPEVRHRLVALSDRYTGSEVIQMRRRPIPWAYRVTFRHVGLDPDEQLTAPEALAMRRMREGRLSSQNFVLDAVTVAVAETGVDVRAFDDERLQGEVGVRPAHPGERLEERATPLPAGSLVLCDERHVLGQLFGVPASRAQVGRGTRRVRLVALAVKGVPTMAVDEALWQATTILAAGR